MRRFDGEHGEWGFLIAFVIGILLLFFIFLGFANAQIGGGRGGIGSGGLIFLDGTDVTLVDSTWNILAPADFKFNGDLMPDGLDCSAGQILEKQGANNWDCINTPSGTSGITSLNGLTTSTQTFSLVEVEPICPLFQEGVSIPLMFLVLLRQIEDYF